MTGKLQVQRIVKDLRKENCIHNDIKPHDILVKDGQIMLVDYSWASLGKDFTLGIGLNNRKKPAGFYNNLTWVVRHLKMPAQTRIHHVK